MKTPFSKVRGLGLLKHDKHHRHAIKRSFAQLEELSQASQDMQDMRDCYDSLLSAAASTTNTAYEFSESLREMGDCLLEKTALSDDEDSGKVLLMLGKVQLNIQKLLDNYRSHINQTITAPSNSLLNELRIVEDMKRQCDIKRSKYEALKDSKEGHVSSHQVQSARDEFDEDATLFIFRMKSLKRGQSRSLLTQAARHYAAQMWFFRKALKTLEAIEPHVKSTTEEQHIDYCFSGLEEDDDNDDDRDSVFLTDNEDEEDEDNNDDYHETLKDVELNNDSHNKNEVSFRENMKGVYIDINTGSKSAPIYMDPSFDLYERYGQQSSTRKLNTYVLPTPLKENSLTSGNESQRSQTRPPTNNMWHSMPNIGPIVLKEKSVVKESNKDTYAKPTPRYAFSGPLTGSGPIGSTPHRLPIPALTRAFSTSQVSSSLNASGMSLPVISELHQLPRPPGPKKPSKLGFSEPLVTFKRGPDLTDKNKTVRRGVYL